MPISRSTRLRVLVADDYPPFLAAIERFLTEHDCDIVGKVEDGACLLEAATRLEPDAILVDLKMPNVNGLQAGHIVRRAVPRSKIIVLTAETDASVVTKQLMGTDLVVAIRLACDSQLA
jgi:DNA-binding NarL/FixJ family response regulator